MTPRPKRLHWLGYGLPTHYARLWLNLGETKEECLCHCRIPILTRWTIARELGEILHWKLARPFPPRRRR